jgi:succinylglutamate desuccinylase
MDKIGVVVCLHGDEPVGLEVKKMLSINAQTFIANPKALTKNVRFLETDMNRCFPGKENGLHEEKCAYNLLRDIKKFKYIVDVHSSSGGIELFGIITKPNEEKFNLAKKMGLKKVIVMTEKFAKGASLIDNVNCAISLEVGPHDRKENALEIAHLIKNLERNFDKDCSCVKLDVFEIFDIIYGDKTAKSYLSNFKAVKKGDIIKEDMEKQFAPFDFVPVFVGEDSYKGIICMAAKKI